jgi:hypothetical protein
LIPLGAAPVTWIVQDGVCFAKPKASSDRGMPASSDSITGNQRYETLGHRVPGQMTLTLAQPIYVKFNQAGGGLPVTRDA